MPTATFTTLTHGSDGNEGSLSTTYATASVTITAGKPVFVVFMESARNTGFLTTDRSLSGAGQTWEHVAAYDFPGGDQELYDVYTIFKSNATSGGSGVLTLTSPTTCANRSWTVVQVEANGAATISFGTIQAATVAVASSSNSLSLSGSADYWLAISAIGKSTATALRVATPRAGWTELSDDYGYNSTDNSATGVQTQVSPYGGDTTAEVTWDGSGPNINLSAIPITLTPIYAVVGSYTGGTKTTVNISGTDWDIYDFTANGSITFSSAGQIDHAMVAGGGGGGTRYYNDGQGGGGAGGVNEDLTGALYVTAAALNIAIGPGGAGAIWNGGTSNISSTGGGNTVLSGAASKTMLGGGKGADPNSDAGSGGSGGGGRGATTGSGQAGGAGTAGQGYAGGAGNVTQGGGGGGGAGGVGANAAADYGGADGGIGVQLNITGTPFYVGGGGGGSAFSYTQSPRGLGGTGGGGSGMGDSNIATDGTDGLGGGGGGSSELINNTTLHKGGDGGSGRFILRVPTPVAGDTAYVWDGAAWQPAVPYVWNGTSWVEGVIHRWSGTAWD